MSGTARKTDGFDCDVTRRYVRVTGTDAAGFVHFEFSIAWPDLSVELVLTKADFDEFCRFHQVELLTDAIEPDRLHDQRGEE